MLRIWSYIKPRCEKIIDIHAEFPEFTMKAVDIERSYVVVKPDIPSCKDHKVTSGNK